MDPDLTLMSLPPEIVGRIALIVVFTAAFRHKTNVLRRFCVVSRTFNGLVRITYRRQFLAATLDGNPQHALAALYMYPRWAKDANFLKELCSGNSIKWAHDAAMYRIKRLACYGHSEYVVPFAKLTLICCEKFEEYTLPLYEPSDQFLRGLIDLSPMPPYQLMYWNHHTKKFWETFGSIVSVTDLRELLSSLNRWRLDLLPVIWQKTVVQGGRRKQMTEVFEEVLHKDEMGEAFVREAWDVLDAHSQGFNKASKR